MPKRRDSKIRRRRRRTLAQHLESRQLLAVSALPDQYTINNDAGQPTSIDATGSVLANDTSDIGAAISAGVVSDPQNGILEFGSDGSFVYTPDLGFVGEDSFVYEATDGDAADVATVTLDVREEISYNIVASEDAGVSERNRTTNYGNASTILIHDDDDGDEHYEFGYFKFDISEIRGDVNSVVFDFTPTGVNGAQYSINGTGGELERIIDHLQYPAINRSIDR